jgi:hypothetical protein
VGEKNALEPEKPQMANITRRMRFACWVTEATDAHSGYVTSYWFSLATVGKRRRLGFILRVNCLTCLFSLRIFFGD